MTKTGHNPVTALVAGSAYTFQESLHMMQKAAMGGGMTEEAVSGDYRHLVKLNYQRMKRVYKTCKIGEKLMKKAENFSRPVIWLVLTDMRCGDSAQSIPVMQRIAELSTKIQLKILFRDDYPEIMDAFLTNGARSIPKLICLDKNTLCVEGIWGPRPEPLQKLVLEHKKNPVHEKEALSEMIQRKYLRDKTVTIQKELLELLESCG